MITIKSVWFEERNIFVKMSDDNIISSPVNLYPNLNKGSNEQLQHFQIKGNGKWIHWEELDEDLSAEGFLLFAAKPLAIH